MDFSYRYTQRQHDFRGEVSDWLDRNAPTEADVLFDSPEHARTLIGLSRTLGSKGWLAPSEPVDDGGAGLSPDLTVIVLEELNRRALLPLVEGESQSLRAAVGRWSSDDQWSTLFRPLARGEYSAWKHSIIVSPGSERDGGALLDPDSVHITATPDADGYLVNGSGLFSGIGNRPNILWTVALVEPDSTRSLPVCLLIDAASEGISVARSRELAASAPRVVTFDDVWVFKSNALGPEGDGHRVIGTSVSLHPGADLPTWVETETEALLDHARTPDSGGRSLGADPVRARILVEAYISSRVLRLLRMRSGWLREQGRDSRRSNALASLSQRRLAAELSEAARSVVGPRALLSSEDPAAPAGGRFDRLNRRELVERGLGTPRDPDLETLASDVRQDA